jgi:hypothetical protein
MNLRLVLVALILLTGLAASGCTSGAATVRSRFANEYDCAEPSVAVKELGGRAYRASGCGRTETYVSSCDGFGCFGPIVVRESAAPTR